MPIVTVQPDADAWRFLPGAQFMDAFITTADGSTLTARQAAERMFGGLPVWARSLMQLRDIIVGPLGLKSADTMRRSGDESIGIFPILSETPKRLVVGLNDRHLDFRALVDVTTAGSQQCVAVTTIVLTHNLLGRIYLAIIMPFHRLIVRAMLRQVA